MHSSQVKTGTSSKTIHIEADGFYTTEPQPECEDCKHPMHPLYWLCGRCGSVDG